MPFYSKCRYCPTHHRILGGKIVDIVDGRKSNVTEKSGL